MLQGDGIQSTVKHRSGHVAKVQTGAGGGWMGADSDGIWQWHRRRRRCLARFGKPRLGDSRRLIHRTTSNLLVVGHRCAWHAPRPGAYQDSYMAVLKGVRIANVDLNELRHIVCDR